MHIPVPTGIDISLKSRDVLGSISKANEKMIVCRGGSGGGPLNNYMAQMGEKVSLVLNLKVKIFQLSSEFNRIQLIADIGLVGFPNAGKSSLLKSISGMPTRIANYAFTTLRPQIASLKYSDGRLITMADLPGNILSFEDHY